MLKVRGVTKTYSIHNGREEKTVLSDINFSIKQGEFVSIIGESGCGKSTFLKCLGGLCNVSSGTIEITSSIEIGYVFQEPRLLPWKTVNQNLLLAFPKNVRKSAPTQEKIDEVLSITGLLEYRNSYPDQLSGGLAQRVGIARALCQNPNVLLMDEPFSALDALTKMKILAELKGIHQQTSCSVVFVTHDVREAIQLSDKVLVMDNGHFVDSYYPKEQLLGTDSLFSAIISKHFM